MYNKKHVNTDKIEWEENKKLKNKNTDLTWSFYTYIFSFLIQSKYQRWQILHRSCFYSIEWIITVGEANYISLYPVTNNRLSTDWVNRAKVRVINSGVRSSLILFCVPQSLHSIHIYFKHYINNKKQKLLLIFKHGKKIY